MGPRVGPTQKWQIWSLSAVDVDVRKWSSSHDSDLSRAPAPIAWPNFQQKSAFRELQPSVVFFLFCCLLFGVGLLFPLTLSLFLPPSFKDPVPLFFIVCKFLFSVPIWTDRSFGVSAVAAAAAGGEAAQAVYRNGNRFKKEKNSTEKMTQMWMNVLVADVTQKHGQLRGFLEHHRNAA